MVIVGTAVVVGPGGRGRRRDGGCGHLLAAGINRHHANSIL